MFFWLLAVAGSVRVGPVNQVNHTSWLAVVTPTDRVKSVRNRRLIEIFVALFLLPFCPFDISVGEEVFVIGLSKITSFSLISNRSFTGDPSAESNFSKKLTSKKKGEERIQGFGCSFTSAKLWFKSTFKTIIYIQVYFLTFIYIQICFR